MELQRFGHTGLWVVQLFNLLSAVGGGVALIVTNGVGMGMPLSLLEASPFDSYIGPGLILLGVFPMASPSTA